MENLKAQTGLAILKADGDKIRQDLLGQFDDLCLMQCPIIEEIIDTQMLVYSNKVDFAKRCGLISNQVAQELVNDLGLEIEALYQAITKKQAAHSKQRD
ncbi:hypothetical protein FC83_GL002482 [Agrilactobacillus composti DSM 18527 = JCM 14202]|uniref:Uncharacterized protein n=1 Tax=Agrilactobacillus composti DSM 18527 = JCM 14202 TaxID=1423734 RepID=X0PDE0_9LACO|nr:DUF1507 family protein [Agrilactobacillus composti]KRM36608.1 hypothetical protein FC83_GL002482 [Agrilactobacillus composti DSM 18527 = JCM 14202]GAF39064.1 hypothetical protein JCM14202_903 [Agrilactobacillus composti DSM 18527 = JCM 14202]